MGVGIERPVNGNGCRIDGGWVLSCFVCEDRELVCMKCSTTHLHYHTHAYAHTLLLVDTGTTNGSELPISASSGKIMDPY